MDLQGRPGTSALIGASVAIALVVSLVVGPVPAGGATLTNAWQARLGSGGTNGTATIQAFVGGTGSVILKLSRFRPLVTLPVTLSKGTCSQAGTTLIRLAAIRTTATGAAVRTSTLTASQVTLLLKATAGGRLAVRVGSSTTGGVKCAVFGVLPVPAYVAATIPIASGPDGPSVDSNGAGVFALGWTDGTVSRVDLATNTLTTSHVEINGAEGPESIAYGDGALWVTTEGPTGGAPWSVQRLDPVTGAVIARIAVDGACGLSTSPGAVWVGAAGGGTISRIDPATNQVVATIHTGENACDPQFAFGSVWAASDEAGAIWRIDPATNTVADRLSVPLGPDDYFSLVFAYDSVWAIDDTGDVLRIDPTTTEVIATIATVGSPGDVSIGAGSVWVSNRGTDGKPDGVLSRIDPATNAVTTTIPVGTNPGPIVFTGGYVWVGLQGEPVVVQVNPATNSVQSRLGVGGIPAELVATEHAVWATIPGAEDATPARASLVRINV